MTPSRDRPAVARCLLAAALGVLTSGCSWMSVQGARPPLKVEDPRILDTCTTSKRAPVVDTVLAGAGFVAGFVAVSAFAAENPDGQGYGLIAAPFWGAGALFTGSAIYGYAKTAQCRGRIVTGGRCANGDLDACQRLKPGWDPPPGWRAGQTLEPRPPPPVAPVNRE